MRDRLAFLIVLVAIAFGGCAIKVIDVPSTIPNMDMAEKFPLRAAVLLREPSMTLEKITGIPRDCNLNPKSFAPYRFGKMFKEASQGVFSQMFTGLDVIHQISVSKEYDIIVEANLDRISNKPGCGFGLGQKGLFKAEGSLRILDRDLNVLWQSRENAAEDAFEIPVHKIRSEQISPIVSESISRSIVSLIQGWGKDLKASLVLYKYVKSLQNLQRRSAGLPDNAPVALASDVDEIAAGKVQGERKNACAVVIGVEQYRQHLPRADFAARDAQTVSQYLMKTLGFPERNVVTLLNESAAKSDFEKYFEKWLPNNVEKDGTVFVYFSGHGAPNTRTGDAYLVPYDGDPAFLDETGYSLKRMYAALEKLPAKEIIVALDSCFSGAGGRSVLAEGARPLVVNMKESAVLPRNVTVLSASSGDQISSTYREKGHGLFTYFLLKSIRNENVVRSDGTLKVDDLYGYIKPHVEQVARKQYNNEQTPQLIRALGN